MGWQDKGVVVAGDPPPALGEPPAADRNVNGPDRRQAAVFFITLLV